MFLLYNNLANVLHDLDLLADFHITTTSVAEKAIFDALHGESYSKPRKDRLDIYQCGGSSSGGSPSHHGFNTKMLQSG